MKLSILLKTSEYRGDHSADVAVAYEQVPFEQVAELVKRVDMKFDDVLEIRVIKESDGHPC